MRHPVQWLLGLTLAGVVAACGGAAATPAPTPVVVTLEATEFAFDQTAISIPAGIATTITLTNGGTIEHDFKVDALNFMVHTTPGETLSGTLTAAAGTYDFYCSIAGHKEAGMVGIMTVN